MHSKLRGALAFHDFLKKKFKGSKKVRLIITQAWQKNSRKRHTNPYINYCNIAGTMPVSSGASVNSIWTLNIMPAEIKTFLFKLHHNIIGLNSRIHHFNLNRDPACTFCNKCKNLPAERETFQHFFWDCPTTSKIISVFFSNF
jgi:hypothetical protein